MECPINRSLAFNRTDKEKPLRILQNPKLQDLDFRYRGGGSTVRIAPESFARTRHFGPWEEQSSRFFLVQVNLEN